MHGIPRVLATKSDYETVHEMALQGYIDKSKAIAHWQSLLSGRYVYKFDRVLEEGEAPDGSEPEYRVVREDREGGEVSVQYRQEHQPGARLYRLGLTDEQIEMKIAEIEEVE